MPKGRDGWCNHYNGTANNETCLAGVRYEDVRDKSTKPFSLPCIVEWNHSGVKCDKCQMPTPEEIAERKAYLEARIEGIGKARAAIVEACGGPWKEGMGPSGGRITCPVCENPESLSFTRSGYNGHIHAACKTEGCVAWME